MLPLLPLLPASPWCASCCSAVTSGVLQFCHTARSLHSFGCASGTHVRSSSSSSSSRSRRTLHQVSYAPNSPRKLSAAEKAKKAFVPCIDFASAAGSATTHRPSLRCSTDTSAFFLLIMYAAGEGVWEEGRGNGMCKRERA